MSKRFQIAVQNHILCTKNLMTKDEITVADILMANWGEGMAISQREIASGERWLAKHKRHRINALENNFETSTRRIRQAIRGLRVKHRIPVLASGDGYWLPQSEEEARNYGDTLLKAATARAEAAIATYWAFMAGLDRTPLHTPRQIVIAT